MRSTFRIDFPALALLVAVVVAAAFGTACLQRAAPEGLRFAVSFPGERSMEPLDGRVILLVSNNDKVEPRFQYDVYSPDCQLGFGIDVEQVAPGQEVVFDRSVFGYPLDTIDRIPAGDYWVQAVFHKYETFRRSDGHTVKLPMDRGEGQRWNQAPGNLYNVPQKVHIDPATGGVIRISLDREIAPLPEIADSKYIKHVRIENERLSKFWGRPMHLGAIVLLPEGFDEHPDARYPVMINHGHFQRSIGYFREAPPDDGLTGRARARAEAAHKFYKDWTGPDFPRIIAVVIQHANPYYDDSYAVNSQNLGPYGDAITYDLIPHIEREFRGIGQGWARGMFGGSTGGWESLAAQIFYPDEYNGCWAACPDPVDFRQYEVIDIYEDRNAFFIEADWKKTPRPDGRNYLGHILSTVEEDSNWELTLGTKGRSGQQWDIWQAVYGPVGEDGYPKEIWDKRTGVIDNEVAGFWRENYDLRHILQRDWSVLGPKLRGKLHIYVGDMDTWHLNNAVYLMEEFLRSTTDPPYEGVVEYGDRQEHCWSGGHNTQYWFRSLEARILKTAPRGSDLKSWRY
jgi:hypothetical protein